MVHTVRCLPGQKARGTAETPLRARLTSKRAKFERRCRRALAGMAYTERANRVAPEPSSQGLRCHCEARCRECGAIGNSRGDARNGIAGGMAASIVIGGGHWAQIGNIGPRSREREIDQADMKREWAGDNQRDLRGLNQQLQVKIELLEEERRKVLTMMEAEEEPEWLQEAERDVERRRRSSTEGSAAESSSPEESIHSPVTVQRPRSSRSALVEEVAAQKVQAAAERAVAARVRRLDLEAEKQAVVAAETAAAEELQLVQQVKAHRASVELLRRQAGANERRGWTSVKQRCNAGSKHYISGKQCR